MRRSNTTKRSASQKPPSSTKYLQQFLFSYWDERLVWTCLIAMCWQWIVMLEPYWFEETIVMSKASLIVLWVASLLFPRHFSGRLFIGLPLILWVVYKELIQYDLWVAGSKISESLVSFHPYIWFVLGLWLVYEAIGQIVRGSGRVIIWLLMQIIVFGILDSFTETMLWEQVAWIVGASLVWLITLHFGQMKQQYPHMWRNSLRYPLQMGMSAFFIIAVIMSIGVSVPEFEPILTDPYTAWSNRYGDGDNIVKRMMSDVTGSNDAPRTSTSGYSQQDSQLGNGFQMDYMPVMTVQSDARGYWRGEAKELYTGQGWRDLNRTDGQERVKTNTRIESEGAPSSDIQTREIKQTFHMLSGQPYPVLFGMQAIESINDIKTENIGELWWNGRDSEIHYMGSPSAPYPESYTVISRVPVVSEEKLRQASAGDDNAAEHLGFSKYIQLPEKLPPRVRDLAEQLTADATNNYDKAKQIESYLRSQFQYTNTPDISLRTSEDFVDGFLFEVKEGYCDYFSTAMAVMLRSVNVPTRWVKGYAPGVREGMSEHMMLGQFDPDSGGTFRVTNADAHSWVEVYMGDYGWIAFEPTPGFSLPRWEPKEEEKTEPIAEQEKNKEKDEDKSAPGQQDETQASLPAWVTTVARIIVLAVLIGALVLLLWRWRSVGFSLRWIRMLKRNLTPDEKIVLETEMWISYCRLKGLRKAPHETVREAAFRWCKGNDERYASVNTIVPLFEQAKYGHALTQEADIERLKAAVRQFKRAG
ncbi:transglutaminase domain-containing protein [Paenibacillus profundus]|uniref:Transglutaminase domain-containing protein n=1 Tax=Paenibacillus profundus TaxID=1173085 RepID=A0ABS8YAB5_9BACL|nr:transglutaminase domain-containing protein [Paenibacillus profundus]MCE5167719.1 transglutaminase domain-containing protein [Paenibacillus profundus]